MYMDVKVRIKGATSKKRLGTPALWEAPIQSGSRCLPKYR